MQTLRYSYARRPQRTPSSGKPFGVRLLRHLSSRTRPRFVGTAVRDLLPCGAKFHTKSCAVRLSPGPAGTLFLTCARAAGRIASLCALEHVRGFFFSWSCSPGFFPSRAAFSLSVPAFILPTGKPKFAFRKIRPAVSICASSTSSKMPAIARSVPWRFAYPKRRLSASRTCACRSTTGKFLRSTARRRTHD